MPRVSIIAAIGRDRVLGKDNALIWRIPDDLKRFRELTMGHPVIMGRRTFESIVAALGTPLPGRTNIVVTRAPTWEHDGAIAAFSIDDALAKAMNAPGGEEIFIGGGAEIYRQALPRAERLYLTRIDDAREGDAYFPPYEEDFPTVLGDEARTHGGLRYRWIHLER